MAVFADRSLPQQTPSPLAPKPAGQKQGATPSYGFMPPMVSDSAVSDQKNNLYAASAGAGQAAMQGMDRAGLSRGRGQQLRADMTQAGADVQSASAAAKTDMDAANSNARTRQAFETAMKGEQLGNQSLLEGLRASGVRERLAKQGWQQDLIEAMRRGQFGLDSMQLDLSPFVQAMFRN